MPQANRIISPARNIDDFPMVAEMVKRVGENIRNRPIPKRQMFSERTNRVDLDSRIREILKER